VHACRRVLGSAAPSRATVYRAISVGWSQTLPTEVGSCVDLGMIGAAPAVSSVYNCWSAHPDWIDYDPVERRPLTHHTSVAAPVQPFTAARHHEGYALRSENRRLRATEVGTPTPGVTDQTPRVEPALPDQPPPAGGFKLPLK